MLPFLAGQGCQLASRCIERLHRRFPRGGACRSHGDPPDAPVIRIGNRCHQPLSPPAGGPWTTWSAGRPEGHGPVRRSSVACPGAANGSGTANCARGQTIWQTPSEGRICQMGNDGNLRHCRKLDRIACEACGPAHVMSRDSSGQRGDAPLAACIAEPEQALDPARQSDAEAVMDLRERALPFRCIPREPATEDETRCRRLLRPAAAGSRLRRCPAVRTANCRGVVNQRKVGALSIRPLYVERVACHAVEPISSILSCDRMPVMR